MVDGGIGGFGRRAAVTEVPDIGQGCIAVGVAASRAVEVHRQRRAVVGAGRIRGYDRRQVARGMGDAAHLAAACEGGVVEGSIRCSVGSELHGDGGARSRSAGEQFSCEAAAGYGRQLEDPVADVVPEEVGPVVGSGPEAVGHEGSACYGLAPRTVAVLVDGSGVGFARAVHRAGARRVVVTALAEVPAVIGAGLGGSISSHPSWPTSLMRKLVP